MYLPVWNLQVFQSFWSLFQPVISNTAQQLHFFGQSQGKSIVNPFARRYCFLTASIHCCDVYKCGSNFSDPPSALPSSHLSMYQGQKKLTIWSLPCWRNQMIMPAYNVCPTDVPVFSHVVFVPEYFTLLNTDNRLPPQILVALQLSKKYTYRVYQSEMVETKCLWGIEGSIFS